MTDPKGSAPQDMVFEDTKALDGSAITRAATGFVWALRNAGLVVPLHSAIEYVGALEAIGFERGYWAGRATLVHRPEDIDLYDRVALGTRVVMN